jgi:hypothetical protein
MAHGLASLGEGRQHRQIGLVTSAVHVVGGALGGMLAGASVWLAMSAVRTLVPQAGKTALLVAAVVAAVAVDLGVVNARIPGRQVPATWRARYGMPRSYLGYGATLGAGVATYVNYAVVLVVFGVLGLFLPLGAAAVGGAAFGSARAATVVLAAVDVRLSDAVLSRTSTAAWAWPKCAATLSLAIAVGTIAT